MGVLNVTPDSFSDGGRYLTPQEAIRHATRMVEEGAEVIDVGGESTRPGSRPVSCEEELRRVIPVIETLGKRLPVPLSIDTSKAQVARCALEAGASMVNDVTALRGDPQMAAVVARAQVPVILMHMRGMPQTMQRAPRYRDVVGEVKAFLAEAIQRAHQAGIAWEQILIDPGLGFGKTVTHNLLLLRHLDALLALGRPVVIGPSRKSFIGRILDAPVDERLAGTLACVAYAARQGIHVVRVHDVKPTVQFLRMWEAIDASWREHRPRRHRATSPAGLVS
jgi:dihydropteroate synthase